ncbi:MAG: B12-binding domain-containing radical SAM protein, partial [Candidatus Aminicenantia bacterium]
MKINKVVLIEPKPAGINVYSMVKLLRLGLPIIASVLKGKGIETSVFVEDIADIDWDEVEKADLIGISSTTSTVLEAFALAEKIRKMNKFIVMGGPHPTFEPEECLKYCDVVVRGEGEETISELINALREDKPLNEIKGISFRDKKGNIIHNPFRPYIRELDSIPDPDFSAVRSFEKVSVLPISTSRGCPFSCEFCSVTTLFGRKYRVRSIEGVISELKKYYPEKKLVFFIDDNFSADPKRTKELLRRIIDEKLKIKWSAQVRVESAMDDELLTLMRKSGCKMVYIGFESINPASLKEVQKNQMVSIYKDAVKRFRKNGIKVHGMFVFGFDNDDRSILRKTVDFAIKTKISTIQFLVLTPIPGSKLYEKMKSATRLITEQWNRFDGHFVVYKPLRLNAYELQKEVIKGMKKFYSLFSVLKAFLTTKPSKTLLSESILRLYGNFTVRKWLKDKKNKIYIKFLKELN